MAQSNQATPSVQANIAGVSTTVNLRDWLNTRLNPFLKRAIIDSLDSEAQYPLQWLGEQLILQSILYEANPDSTNIRERFLYKHDIKTTVQAPPQDSPQDSQPKTSQENQTADSTSPQLTTVVVAEPREVAQDEPDVSEALATATAAETMDQDRPAQPETNGTAQDANVNKSEDTEMVNAS